MSRNATSRRTTRRILGPLVAGVAVLAVIAGTLGCQPVPTLAPHGADVDGSVATASDADGALPDGVTVFDSEQPGVVNLDPGLLQALRTAATDAAEDGVKFHVNSGWRSAGYQNQLFDQAVTKYGSREEALRWVADAASSAHVTGDAVDIGSSDATEWLSRRGAAYGLCQTYGNEFWHYELRPEAIGAGCPPEYPDPTDDPRMRH